MKILAFKKKKFGNVKIFYFIKNKWELPLDFYNGIRLFFKSYSTDCLKCYYFDYVNDII